MWQWKGTPAVAALLAFAIVACDTGDRPGDAGAADTAASGATGTQTPITVQDAGLSTPESVLHDEAADVYLVSNINGAPTAKDDNGFISRVRPDGSIESLKWIDGAAQNVTLNAPKGLAVKGDTLFVSDIDSVRAFDRNSGASLGARGIPNASFLNDLAVGGDGTLYVTDTGVDANFAPDGRAAIYAFHDATPHAVAQGASLPGPNGIAVDGDEIIMVGFASPGVFRLPAGGGEPRQVATVPAGMLDGVFLTADGDVVVSSWEGSAVWRVGADGQVTAVAENVPSPADIGYDARRNRVLIPVFNENRVEIRDVR